MSTELVPIDVSIQELATACVARLAPNTQRAYSTYISEYLRMKIPVTREGISAWLAKRKQYGTGAVTINVALAALKLLAREAWIRGLMVGDCYHAIDDVKSEKVLGQRLGQWTDETGVERLLESCIDNRERAIIAIMCGCGLRRSEVCALKWGQYREASGRMVLADIIGKGGRIRSLGVPEWAAQMIEAYRGDEADPNAPVFPSNARIGQIGANKHLTPFGLVTIIQKICDRAGAELQKLRCHDLRRSFAGMAQSGGAEIQMIKQALGHSSIVTTERYLNQVQNLKMGKTAGDHIKVKACA